MTTEKAIKMIDEYLEEPNSIDKEWIECLRLCKQALIDSESQKAEIERNKGVIKLLEKDVASAASEVASEQTLLLIDKAGNGVIHADDIPDYAYDVLHKSDESKTEFVPVSVVHGVWVDCIESGTTVAGITARGLVGYKCSVCGRYEGKKEPYCNCGAKMDIGQVTQSEND